MKFYAAIISKYNGHAVCGKYFDHATDAWKYIKPDCGYSGSIVVYKNGAILKMVERV